jgi:hypothetical protein
MDKNEMMTKNKLFVTFTYLLKGFMNLTLMAFLCILANLALTMLIYRLTDQSGRTLSMVMLTAPVDVTAGLFALLAGLLMLLANFRVALANGVSRKTFLLANLPAAVTMAAGLALINQALLLVFEPYQPFIMVTHLIYPTSGWIGILLVQVAQYFSLIAAGWLIVLAYYRGSVLARWIISVTPFALLGLYRVVDVSTGGKFAALFGEFWLLTMRSTTIMATITMVVYSGVLVVLVYLLIRRAPIKNRI